MSSKWGIYPWFKEHGDDLIHPDDLDAFARVNSNSKVFECIGDGEYLTLRYNNNYYRVKEKLFKSVPSPKYSFGEIVKLKKNGKEAVVTDVMWHYGKQEHYYFISIENKKKSKRYSETDFVKTSLS